MSLLESPPPADPGNVPLPPPAESWSWAKEDGTFHPGWADKLPDGLKGHQSLMPFQKLDQLAKAYVDTKAMVGKRTAPPTDKSTPEEIAAWRQLVGAPDKLEDYGALKPQDVPDEIWSADVEAEAKALAHKYHLPPAVLKEFAALQAKGAKGAFDREVETAKKSLEEGRMKLRTEWGESFDRNKARALAVAAALGIPENDDIFLSRPDILSRFASSAQTFLGGDQIVAGSPIGAVGGIASHIASIRESPEYQGKRGAAAQQQAQERLHQLYKAQNAAKVA